MTANRGPRTDAAVSLSDATRRAWAATDYRVHLASGGYASIRCGQPLPAPLRAWLRVPEQTWGYLTAWNPAGRRLPRATNRSRQRRLRDALQAKCHRYLAGAGVGKDGWREPSLFVPGITFAELDELARSFGQLGVLRGTGTGLARLHELM